MKISEMIRDLADQPYRKDYRLQRHIIEDDDCQEAKVEMAHKMGPHDAGHMLVVIDAVLLYINEHGMPEDMEDVLSTYRLNGAKNRRGGNTAVRQTPELTASDWSAMWGDDKEDD